MIKADKNICTRCMTCISVCPFTVLKEIEGYPAVAEGKACIKCFHCAAACPRGAITYRQEPAIIINKDPHDSSMGEFHKVGAGDVDNTDESFAAALKGHILKRRSYRHFIDKKVPRSLIEEALELASWAPSAKNQHPTKWIIIESEEYIEKIMDTIVDYVNKTGTSTEILSEMAAGNNVVMGQAKTMILAYAADQAISPETDTAIAMTTAELYLQANGVGTCWAGYFKRMCNNIPEVKAMLPKIPKTSSFYGAFMVGYPQNEKYIHVPNRIKRADIKIL